MEEVPKAEEEYILGQVDMPTVEAMMREHLKYEDHLNLHRLLSHIEAWYHGASPISDLATKIGGLTAKKDFPGTRATSFVIRVDDELVLKEIVVKWITGDAPWGTLEGDYTTGEYQMYAASGTGLSEGSYKIFPSRNVDAPAGDAQLRPDEYYLVLMEDNEKALRGLQFDQEINCYVNDQYSAIVVGEEHHPELREGVATYVLKKKRALATPGGIGTAIYVTHVPNAEHQKLLENVFRHFTTPRYLKFN